MSHSANSFLFKDLVLVDLTGFFREPTRTGIQRATWEIVRRCRDPRLTPIVFEDNGSISVLPDYTFEEMTAYFRAEQTEFDRQRYIRHGQPPVQDQAGEKLKRLVMGQRWTCDTKSAFDAAAAVFVPEVFFDGSRITSFLDLIDRAPDKFFILVYDLILWLRTRHYPHVDWSIHSELLNYIRVVRASANVGCISDFTADEVRTLRGLPAAAGGTKRPGDPDIRVFPLGSDTFSKARRPAPERPHFCLLGTVEPRKHALDALRAFKVLHERGLNFEVTVVGKKGWLPEDEAREWDQLVDGSNWVKWRRAVPDGELEQIVARSTAAVYLSEDEGYGLPPVEALWLGVPVVVQRSLPSIQYVRGDGIVYVEDLATDTIADALTVFFDKDKAAALRAAADVTEVPTWVGCSADVWAWVGADQDGEEDLRSVFWKRLWQVETFGAIRDKAGDVRISNLLQAVWGRPITSQEYADWWPKMTADPKPSGETLLLEAATVARVPANETLFWLDAVRGGQPMPAVVMPNRREPWDHVVHTVLKRLYGFSGREFVEAAYAELLGRGAGPGEGPADVPGEARVDLLLGIVESNEYKTLFYRPIEPTVLRKAIDLDKEIATVVGRLLTVGGVIFLPEAYQGILGRRIDSSGQGAYSRALAGGATRQDVIRALFTCDEYVARNQDLRAVERLLVRLSSG